MKVSVWDKYVERKDGKTMHLDILVPSNLESEHTIYGYGKEFLKSKPFQTANLTSKECKFCHIEEATDAIKNQIHKNGFFIIEMEYCN